MKVPKGALKLLAALLLLPLSLGAVAAAARLLARLAAAPGDPLYFVGGLAAYPVLHALLGRPTRLYVFGHELTHALAAWMHGYKVLGFSVSKSGGHVDVSRSNAVVALAPYVVPVYALAVIAAYRAWLGLAAGGGPLPQRAFLAALGAALSFHLVHTGESLWDVRQPDLRAAGGVLFSLVLIGLGNAACLLLASKCLFPRLVSLADAAEVALAPARACGHAAGAVVDALLRL